MRRLYISIFFTLLLLAGAGVINKASAQKFALKTNALYWATCSPNISGEIGLAPRWTFELGAGVNPFTFNDNKKWKHYSFTGEARYWLCEKFYRHFIGFHAGGGEMNISRANFFWVEMSNQKRYEGWAVKAGISYGYAFTLGGRWNMEATLGVGVVHADYNQFGCAHCADIEGKYNKTVVAPTKAGISLVYMIR